MSKKFSNLKVFADPGHAWLRVPKKIVMEACAKGLQLSAYSYMSKKYVYIEEDGDLSAFVSFFKLDSAMTRSWKISHTNSQSHVRKYPDFKVEL